MKVWLAHALCRQIKLEIDSGSESICRRVEVEMTQSPFQSWCRVPWQEQPH